MVRPFGAHCARATGCPAMDVLVELQVRADKGTISQRNGTATAAATAAAAT